jgi:phosphoglycerate-specific signal transduction histidine kinase
MIHIRIKQKVQKDLLSIYAISNSNRANIEEPQLAKRYQDTKQLIFCLSADLSAMIS